MNITQEELTIRNALPQDAPLLAAWWNDGEIMAHAGFPQGLTITPEQIAEDIKSDTDDTRRLHIIEINGVAIGEMNYRNMGNRTARIGIKLCEKGTQDKGYGTRLLMLFIHHLFALFNYETIALDTNQKNARARHVYEKMGFRHVDTSETEFKQYPGEIQTIFFYELTKENFCPIRRPL